MVAGKAVLVVEDDPLLRFDAATMFAEAGLSVIEMETADEAMAYLRTQARDIGAVFTDVQFPGEADGFDLAGMVAANWPHVTVLVTSGRARRCGLVAAQPGCALRAAATARSSSAASPSITRAWT